MATPKIRSANAASTSILAPELPQTDKLKEGRSYEISLVKSENLSKKAQDSIFKLFDENMYDLQKTSSFPYTEQSKREELFDQDARYIILLSPPQSLSSTPIPIVNGNNKKGKAKEIPMDFDYDNLLGFCGFRFDTEETLSSRDAEVVYCYEVQLSIKCRGQGLGKRLLDILEEIGRKRGLDKVILTCLKSNESALAFYTKQGYIPDEIDPTRINEQEPVDDDEEEEEEEVDYRILSKSLKRI
ncbi:hypothetical protein I203_102065 [Kwoniella mangroviensis CBS 8507]|uniref:uncharacterized protein n=1 Tax=Kwoniella mangroviensis CBS 8507 TaxID=1296122 RepID=UPI00080CE147|nr:uncharacterized protein I203_03260 [Kwoniella mangroviensis CBS 8507]OCF67563.1 hypothetical protein I203_03260 [Kwoniella mangroviensis CBS 8507]